MMDGTPWRRHALGAISLALIAVGVAIWLLPGASKDWALAQGVSIKTGTTLLMCWLAYPQLARLSPWKVIVVVLVGATLVFRPQLIRAALPVLIYLAPVLLVVWLIRGLSRQASS